MKHKLISGAVAAAAAIAIYFAFFSTSDEQKIKNVLAHLAKAVRVTEEGKNPILRAARVHSDFVDVFQEQVVVHIPEMPAMKQGRAELEGTATQASFLFRTADVELGTVDVKVDDAHTSAKASATATLRATRRDGSPEQGPRAVNFLLRKDDGVWRITSLTVWPDGEALP